MDLEKPSLWLSDLGDQKARVPCPCFFLQRVTPSHTGICFYHSNGSSLNPL